MPLIPELAIAMLACARLARHSVVFGGFQLSLIDQSTTPVTVVVTAVVGDVVVK
jgi:acyl-coenzyme A synthetase/AMP-(fatty) acid ligase